MDHSFTGEENRIMVLFHLGLHGCEYVRWLVASQTASPGTELVSFPSSNASCFSQCPILGISCLQPDRSFIHSKSLQWLTQDVYTRVLVWIKSILLKQISCYPHLPCFLSHYGSVLESLSQIHSRWNWSGKCAPGAYLMYCTIKGSTRPE